MSYILDALRKAERERGVQRVPTLETVHRPELPVRPRVWPWVAAGVLAAGVVVLAVLLRSAPSPVAPPAAAPPAPAASTPPPEARTAAAPSDAGRREPARAAVATPESAGPQVTHEAEQTPRAVPDAPRVSPPTPGRAGSRVRPDPAVPPAPFSAPVAPAGSTGTPPVAGAPPATSSALSTPAPSLADPPTSIGGLALPSPPLAPPPASAALRERVARLNLDVLVYSEREAERMVFINGRRYVEGQTLDGGILLERITHEGAVLRHEGQRVLLQPRLNPYIAPRP